MMCSLVSKIKLGYIQLCVVWYSVWCGTLRGVEDKRQKCLFHNGVYRRKRRCGKLAVFSKVCLFSTIALCLPSVVAPATKTNEADCIVLVSRILNCKFDSGFQKDSKTALIVLRINKKHSFKSETRRGLLKR